MLIEIEKPGLRFDLLFGPGLRGIVPRRIAAALVTRGCDPKPQK
jgi:hypothetical protein